MSESKWAEKKLPLPEDRVVFGGAQGQVLGGYAAPLPLVLERCAQPSKGSRQPGISKAEGEIVCLEKGNSAQRS